MANPLLELISRGESGVDGYNAYNRGMYKGEDGMQHFRGPDRPLDLSQLTVGQLLDLQHADPKDPDRLFAVGKYQIIPSTMAGAIKKLGLSRDEPFTPEFQDRIFSNYLIVEKQSAVHDYITSKPGASIEAAQRGLAREWASFGDPDKGGKTHYAPPNHASITLKQSADALIQMRADYQAAIDRGLAPDVAWQATTRVKPAQVHVEPGQSLNVLHQGVHGDAVFALQANLTALGYTDNRGRPLEIDGHYGFNTEAAVRAFQGDRGLQADGVAGERTLQALHNQRALLGFVPAFASELEGRHATRIGGPDAGGQVHMPSPSSMSASASAPPVDISGELHRQQGSQQIQQNGMQRLQEQLSWPEHLRILEQAGKERREQEQMLHRERQPNGAYRQESPPIPDHLRDFRHPDHPMHQRYLHALGEVHYMEDQHKIPHGEHSERLAAAMVDRLHEERFGRLEKLELRGQGKDPQVVAHQSRPSVYMPEREVSMSVNQATARSVEAVAHDWSERAMPHFHAPTPTMAPERLPDPHTLPAHDLRHPDHPQYALYQQVHAQVAEAFAKAGVPRSEAQLEHATAATLLQAQINQADWSKPTQITLAQDPTTGTIGPDSNLSIRTQDRVFGDLTEIVPASTMQQAPEVSFQQMGQVAQQQAQDWAAFEQQRMQANMQQHLYPTMPGGGPGGGP